MSDEKHEHVPISWWLYRDLAGNATRVSDEQPVQDIYFNEDGFPIRKIARPNPDTYEILLRRWPKKIRTSMEEYGPGGKWVLDGTAHRITKAEFETYQAFGLFDE